MCSLRWGLNIEARSQSNIAISLALDFDASYSKSTVRRGTYFPLGNMRGTPRDQTQELINPHSGNHKLYITQNRERLKMPEQKLMIAARKKNGQIGYISEGYSLPEFLSFIRPLNEINIMIDYSPVIDLLYELHKNSGSTEILIDYTNLNNYWRESKSFKRESIRTTKAEELSRMSSALIAKLQIGINRKPGSFYNKNLEQAQTLVSEITSECNIYIDTLLYYIHSKATLEIESFTRDSVIAEHGKFIEDFIRARYKDLLTWGSRGNDVLTYMVFERPDDATYFLQLDNETATLKSHKLKVFGESTPQTLFNDHLQEYQRVLSVNYPSFDERYISLLIQLRDFLYKTKSINQLIERLKAGEVGWDETGNHAQTIADEIVVVSAPGRYRLR